MSSLLITLILLIAFFVWASHVLRKRGPNVDGPTAGADRHRKRMEVSDRGSTHGEDV